MLIVHSVRDSSSFECEIGQSQDCFLVSVLLEASVEKYTPDYLIGINIIHCKRKIKHNLSTHSLSYKYNELIVNNVNIIISDLF